MHPDLTKIRRLWWLLANMPKREDFRTEEECDAAIEAHHAEISGLTVDLVENYERLLGGLN
jgi:hypothetical protein